MKLSNYTVFQYAQNLSKLFEKQDIYIPVRANFKIQKNINSILNAAQHIDTLRLKIGQHYGELDVDKSEYRISPDKQDQANQELADLFNIEQDLDIKTFKLEDLGNVELTPQQMQAIMFMIEE